MKKLINDPRFVVREMLEGHIDLTPGVALLEQENVVVRTDLPPVADRTVAIISGGGAGHEPAHAGYVGAGMLHAAVVGDVFTSPSVDAVVAAIFTVAGPAGVLLIVKNYTGDRLNFGLAAEIARTAGIPAEVVVVADDVALHATVEERRRRGIAGTVLVHKIAGALAEAGAGLQDIALAARAAASLVGTMGVALGACTVPAAGTPGFELGATEIELGLGIHGEKGVSRETLRPVDGLVGTMVDTILVDRKLVAGARVALLVNGLGGTPPMELAIVARAALAQLRSKGLIVERAWCGTFLSAIEMPGCSLSVMAVTDDSLALLDHPTAAPAWPGLGVIPSSRSIVPTAANLSAASETYHSQDDLGALVVEAILRGAAELERQEGELTRLDSAAGDGDLGISMARGADALRSAFAAHPPKDAAGALSLAASTLRRAIAGSSGPFYAVGLLRAARSIAESKELTPSVWATAFGHGVDVISALGGAKPGDRTMIDALAPAVAAFQSALDAGKSPQDAWSAGVEAAHAGAAATSQMQPRLGRASYLGQRAVGVPDAGAAAVAIWIKALMA